MDYKNFLIECNNLYNGQSCGMNYQEKLCQECFDSEFYKNGTQNAYDCYAGCLYYAMHYGLAYISEIYHLLEKFKINENDFNEIRVTSLGGGFGTDYLAIEQYAANHQMPINLHHSIYDISPIWQKIISLYNSNNQVSFFHYDLTLQTVDLSFQNIVFINKLVSTLKATGKLNLFLPNLSSSLQSLPVGSCLIFNDVNHWDKGRDNFLQYMSKNHPEMQLIGKYYFQMEGAYSGEEYHPIEDTGIVFDISHLNLSCEIMTTVRKTFFAVYQKVI